MKLLSTLITILSLTVFSCSNDATTPSLSSKPAEIIVGAAASLKDAFNEIGPLYETQTGVRAHFNFSASGILQKQIEAGTPIDVFASAGEKQMDELQKKGLIIQDTRRDLAQNALVLVVPKNAPVPLRSFSDLDNPKVERLAIGNPKTVPAGQYAQQALTNTELWEKLQPRFVLAEDVRQVLDYVARGDVEAGIVYATDVPIARGKVQQVALAPEGSYTPVRYPIAVIKDSHQPEAARKFIELILGREGERRLKKYGFLAVR